jgi:hypothetical protein
VERLKPSTLAAIKIALPHKPFGRLPVVIHARSIDYKKRVASLTTCSNFVPKCNLSQNLRMNRHGSTNGMFNESFETSCI